MIDSSEHLIACYFEGASNNHFHVRRFDCWTDTPYGMSRVRLQPDIRSNKLSPELARLLSVLSLAPKYRCRAWRNRARTATRRVDQHFNGGAPLHDARWRRPCATSSVS